MTWDLLPQTHYTFIFMNVIMWISLLVANQKDPGFLAKNTEEYHRLDRDIKLITFWNKDLPKY